MTRAVFAVLGTVLVGRSEEHTSELQSRVELVCRLLREKKNKRASHTGQLATRLHIPHTQCVREFRGNDVMARCATRAQGGLRRHRRTIHRMRWRAERKH